MAYDLAKVTANGNNLIAQILANKSSLSVDKIEISDTQLPSTTDISTMTSVPKVVQTVSANGFSKNSNTLIISTVVDNSSIRADYKAWVFGIWGSDSQNGQSQLIAVITSTNSPDTIPAFSGSTPVSYTYKFNIGFSNASQIQFNMIDDSFATNDTVVHTTGDETIDGQKKFKTDPTDSAGNAYAKTVDVNQQLDKKVVDNKDGTEQLNGVQVQPFNKLSDTIGGRNMARNPDDVLITPVDASGWSSTLIGTVTPEFFKITDPITTQPITISFEISTPDDPPKTNLFDRIDIDGEGVMWGNDDVIGTNYFSVLGFKWLQIGNNIWKGTYALQYNQGSGVADSKKLSILLLQTKLNTTPRNFTVLGNSLCLYWGTQATDWTPAPEDKVNVSDMRKPASDVAGIEEVNAKQDEIGYTPADDSKVVHSTDMRKPASDVVGLEDVSTSAYQSQLANGTDIHTVTKDGIYPLGYSYVNFIDSNPHWGTLQVINNNSVIVHIARMETKIWFETCAGSPMTWGVWHELSSDDEVAHLSGANNFDTIPTVDDNPLLLASSLPSDLARTGSDQEFTGKNTFDTAPVDKTTGNPYITKDGVPSDVARTGQAQTFTAAQTFSIAPTIKDASTDKGDNQAATMADLKSVEANSWRIMTGSSQIINPYSCLYRINTDEERIEFILWGTSVSDSSSGKLAVIDFSSIVTGISSVTGYLSLVTNISGTYPLVSSGTRVLINNNNFDSNGYGAFVFNDYYNPNNQPAYAYYTGLK